MGQIYKFYPKDDIPVVQLDHRKPRSRYKFKCPQCGQESVFTRYIFVDTAKFVGDEFGICDRADKCGYHRVPTGKELKDRRTNISINDVHPDLKRDLDSEYFNCIPGNRVFESMKNYDKSPLFQFLSRIYGEKETYNIFLRYNMGVTDYWYWDNPVVFWQIDSNGIARTGKIMDYKIIEEGEDWIDVKRVKETRGEKVWQHISWLHLNEMVDFNMRQCLFGEHLLNVFPQDVEVNVVESEKTALFCSLENPQKLFMATGGIQNLRDDTMNVLKGRSIVLWPDKGEAYNIWRMKAMNNLPGYKVKVHNFLETRKEEFLKDGDDIADFFIKRKLNKKGD